MDEAVKNIFRRRVANGSKSPFTTALDTEKV
jgi:hypothetical protein